MAKFRSLNDLDVAGKRVLIRLDLNVPIEDGKVRDTTRIDRVVPTLNELLEKKAAVVVLAHFGRPKGKAVPAMSLQPVVAPLSAALKRDVRFVATDWQSDTEASGLAGLQPGEIAVLENTRFHPGEETNDAGFARHLASLGDVYVNDAFSAAHRAHASTEGVAHLLPSAAGRAMQAELEALEAALGDPKRPLVAVVGGAKVSTKLELLGNLSGVADSLIIGGGMANTFLAAQGVDIGKSLCEHDMLNTARDIVATAKANDCEIELPRDCVVAKEFAAGAENRQCPATDVSPDEMILDIGSDAIAAVNKVFDKAATLVWNGPFGAFEISPFDRGTVETARHAAELTRAGKLISVAGGGDTVAALNHAGAAADFSYVSTAGGAFLEWLEGKVLPGVKVLEK